jgi:hypothetical protein
MPGNDRKELKEESERLSKEFVVYNHLIIFKPKS